MPAWLSHVLQAWAQIAPAKRSLVVLIAAAAVCLLATSLAFGWPVNPWSLPAPWRSGSIYVSGPQVYTRERLVNDRYREDAWLLGQLRRFESAQVGFAAKSTIERSRMSTGGIIVGSQPASESNHADNEHQSSPAPSNGNNVGSDKTDAKLSPFQEFQALRVFREQIRNLIIENQLDDRHDLRGNSLYRLRFDAAVLPGSRRKNAKITVSILPPRGLLDKIVDENADTGTVRREEDRLTRLRSLSELESSEVKEVWNRLYLRWLDSLQKRFANSRKGLLDAYESNRFSLEDYDVLLNYLRQQVRYWWIFAQNIDRDMLVLLEMPFQDRRLLAQMQSEDPQLLAVMHDELLDQQPADSDSCLVPSARREFAISSDDHTQESFHSSCKMFASNLIKTIVNERKLISALQFKLPSRIDDEVKHLEESKLPSKTATGTQQSIQDPAQEQNQPEMPVQIGQSSRDEGQLANASACERLHRYILSSPVRPTLGTDPDSIFFAAFQLKSFKSLIGLDPGALSLRDSPPQTAGARKLVYLDQLADVALKPEGDRLVQSFQRQTSPLFVAGSPDCLPDTLKPNVKSRKYYHTEVYFSQGQLDAIQNMLPEYDPEPELRAIAKKWRWLRQEDRAEPITVDVGLINFIRSAGRQLDVFSYALPPSEPDELTAVSTQETITRSLAGRGDAADVAKLIVSMALKEAEHSKREDVEVRKPIVGFGEQRNSAIATFGWVFYPHTAADQSLESMQSSLTALISLPAWWEEVRVRIRRSWTDLSENGDQPFGTESEYTVELPVNFEAVDASVFEANDRSPVVNERALRRIAVDDCENADIVIPGTRLWRSTVVTLGSQPADQIYVLPDMNGIIASFRPVKSLQHPTEKIYVPLTVATSEGSATLSHLVTIRPSGKPQDSIESCYMDLPP